VAARSSDVLMTSCNLIILMSDQHTASVLGAYGNEVVDTPNLDALCEHGTRFTAAYANSPICIPSRTSFATGRYVNELKLWDNDLPYDGSQAASWGERVYAQGHHVTTIGKLHYASATGARAFPDQRLPMHFVPDVQTGFLRDSGPIRTDSRRYVETAGPGDSEYVRYDSAITEEAIRWITEEAPELAKPWVLFVSFACPHFPLEPPPELYALYADASVPDPVEGSVDVWPRHPALHENRRLQGMDDPFTAEQVATATRAYYALVTFVDRQVGRIMEELARATLAFSTRVIYTSDHGESLGEHGLWWKSNMYDGAVRVPLIVAGPDVPHGKVSRTPVSLVDIFPTVVEGVGGKYEPADADLSGASLWELAIRDDLDRSVFSEYHADFSASGIYMLRTLRWKYVHYVGWPPQLFDMQADPSEVDDLANVPSRRAIRAQMERGLREIMDPEVVDEEVRADQRARIARRGGIDAIVGRVTETHSPPPTRFRDR
jgi:choline-sulfatase